MVGIDYQRVSTQADFYKDFKEMNPLLIVFLICISLGLYIINWIWAQNKELLKVDKDAPDPNRGAALLFILPVGWYFITFVVKNLILEENVPFFVVVIESIVWLGIFFVLLKYLYDFCMSFSKVTKNPGMLWFFMLSIGMFGLSGFATGHYIVLPFIGFLVITIPAMQAELNQFCKKFTMKKKNSAFYDT